MARIRTMTLVAIVAIGSLGAAASAVVAATSPTPSEHPGGVTLVVDQAGGRDFATITEAVAAADGGDVVVIRPGTYTEAILIDEDITLQGDGSAEEIVIIAPEQASAAVSQGGDLYGTYALFLDDSNAMISGMTIQGQDSVVFIRGGAPTLRGLLFDNVGITETSPDEGSVGSSVILDEGSAAVLRDSVLVGGGPIAALGASTPLIEANHLSGGPRIYGEFGNAAIVRGNTIEDTPARPAIILWEGGEAIVEGNTIIDAGREGIGVRTGTPTIRGNTILGAVADGIRVRGSDAAPWIIENTIEDVGGVGIDSTAGSARMEGNRIARAGGAAISVTGVTELDVAPVIIRNVLRDDAIAISWGASAGIIADNDIAGGIEGILIGTGSPVISRNRVAGVERRGLFVGAMSSPTLAGNSLCGNGQDLVIEQGARVTGEDTLEICADTPAG